MLRKNKRIVVVDLKVNIFLQQWINDQEMQKYISKN